MRRLSPARPRKKKKLSRAYMARISPASDAVLEEIAAQTGKSKVEIIDRALEVYSFHEKMRLLNEEYERLRSDENKWNLELKERKQLEGTLSDGLEDY